ncbi:MAG: polyribonucleotide nucleotidyltransferase [Deltaproteobacteria bacterium]|jgi:polyribonucleotide nucleotidyltransferase|nr:polyribonucleotide nucleotidyltransferase [Deltaproteobacteria bacterium]
MVTNVETQLGGRTLKIETGRIAKQAGGSVTVHYGDSVVLVTTQARSEASENRSFLPLSVDYTEKTYAAGKIPGGFFKREGRPTEREILTSRLIDRPVRPLFPDGYFNETQIIATVLSADNDHDPDTLGIIGASAALTISPYPFKGPIAGVRVGRVDGKFVINPTEDERLNSDIDMIVAGTKDAIVMVEGGAELVSEEDMVEALMFAHEGMQPVIEAQLKLQKDVGTEKWADPVLPDLSELRGKVEAVVGDRVAKAVTIPTKLERYAALDALKKQIVEEVVPEDDETAMKDNVKAIFGDIKKDFVRKMIVNDSKRIDGRGLTDVRPIACDVAILPRTHGSALFTRGETQVLTTVTLGTKRDQQLIENITADYYKKFILHYNFPPFSVGEVKFLRGASRREIGHGALAERSIMRVLPKEEDFPYTVRAVSEVLESNGSSSMATVCGTTLAMMDAGVPIQHPVAGVAMGLIDEDGKKAVLTDILGDEDHLGDMDFKVTGTRDGVAALQMDIKIGGIDRDVLNRALAQARDARLHILDKMNETISVSRKELSKYAPKLTMVTIPVAVIGDLIGPGGKNVRRIIEETGASIDINDDGTVLVGAVDQASGDQALREIRRCTASPEAGKFYKGKVVRIADFGAFVEIFPKKDGLLHISEIAKERIKQVSDVLKMGDEVVVKVTEIDKDSGKIRLSRKDAFGHEDDVEEI